MEMAESNMEMDSILSCVICLDLPKDAVICRHCSQPFCSSCIDVISNHFSFINICIFRIILHKISMEIVYPLVHFVGKWNSDENKNWFVFLNRKEVQRNEFIKLLWCENLLKLINDKKDQSENTKLNKFRFFWSKFQNFFHRCFRCSEHAREELCNYCSTCSKTICAQCILPQFNGKVSWNILFE